MPIRLTAIGIRGATLVAVTYVYFLIFAQFGFLARLGEWGIAGSSLKTVMVAMALGGILFSLLAAYVKTSLSAASRVRLGLGLCAASAFASSLLRLDLLGAIAIAFLVAAGLGILTVTLVAHLDLWVGHWNPILMIGLGTGFGYFVCNIPAVFNAIPRQQALLSGLLCVAALALPNTPSSAPEIPQVERAARVTLPIALSSFAALIWLDSAAFYIIQHAPELKANTWMGNTHLWTNGCIHLFAALLAGLLLRARGSKFVLGLAIACLGFACLLLARPALAFPASLFYPAGVSFYSVVLVAYPSFLGSAATPEERAHMAGWIYAIAGWIGSALGIGMGQNLGKVPPAFVAAASAFVLWPAFVDLLRLRARESAVLGGALCAGFLLHRLLPSHTLAQSSSPIERGRQVYISEGCIHCHSQYVRPNSADVLMWGPVMSLEELRSQRPPLIGNRRQGPDLAEVGLRRSSLWLKAHLIDPAQVSGGSIMPSYSFLFNGREGDDLTAYLASLRSPNGEQRTREEQEWHLPGTVLDAADPTAGEVVYRHDCATCHDAGGATRVRWHSAFTEPPANLFTGPLRYLPSSDSVSARVARLAQIAKFGIPGTDMPGHEYLSDEKIASLTRWLTQHIAEPRPHS
jgi:cytochrome c oxidase cbb3-type subunit 2